MKGYIEIDDFHWGKVTIKADSVVAFWRDDDGKTMIRTNAVITHKKESYTGVFSVIESYNEVLNKLKNAINE